MKNLYFQRALSCTAACLFPCLALNVRAQWFDQGAVFSVTEENDTFFNEDRYYTQGIKLSYLHSDNHLPGWLKNISDAIPAFGYEVKATRIGTQIGQDIYTPNNLKTNALIVNDRPFAGWLYTGFILQKKGLTQGGVPVLENIQLDLGVIGPSSLAEDAQDLVHNDNGQGKALGWDHQLKNEPGVALKYQRSWVLSRMTEHGHRSADLIPYTGFSLGNVDTSFRAGGQARLGVNLPADFGVQTAHSLTTVDGGQSESQHDGRYGFFIFTGVEGYAVLYNAFLDGNLYQTSHHVTKEPLVGECSAGVGLVFPAAEVLVSAVYRTHEFTQQDKNNTYGSVVVKFKL